MTLRFSANLSTLWPDRAPIERFDAAAAAGFDTVEMLFPNSLDENALISALTSNGLTMGLFDVYAGDWESGERGVAALADRVDESREKWLKDIELADAIGVDVLTVLAGIRPEGESASTYDDVLIDNLSFLSEFVSAKPIKLAVEAINNYDVPGFHVRTIDHAAKIVEAVGSDNVGVQFDQYHVSREHQDPVSLIERYIEVVRHVQIADSPGRHEPGSGTAPVFEFLLRLEELGYPGRVGLEYTPSRDTDASLNWLPEKDRSG